MQFSDLLQRDVPGLGPASYLTTGVYELMVHAQARSPTSSFLLRSLFNDALGLPQAAYLDFPRSRGREVAVGRYPALFVAFGIRSKDILLQLIKPAALHWAPRPRTLGRPRRRVRGTFNTMVPRDSKRAGGRYHAPSLSGEGGAFTERNGAGSGEKPDHEGAA